MNDQAAAEEAPPVDVPEPPAEEKPKKKRAKPEPESAPDDVTPAPEPVQTIPARELGAPHVYTAINDVKYALARSGGITKDNRTNYGDKYKFRGIDDMYNKLCALTVEAGLVMIPRVVETTFERETGRSGGAQTHVWLVVEVDFVSTVDGTKHTGRFVGEAIDTSDKASNKAMSGAMKYACIMAFQIPTDGKERDDIEYEDHQVGTPAYEAPKAAKTPKAGPKLDTSEKSLDWQVAVSEKVSVCDDFKKLYEIRAEADTSPEPGRGVILGRIHDRAAILISTADPKKLTDSKALIQSLGSPPTLMAAYNKRYGETRGQK